MAKIFLALGSNIGDKKANIDRAIELLKKKIKDISVSSYYLTKPVGYLKQENFINVAIVGQTLLSPQELLEFIREVEENLGRVKRFKNGPREIDIDILFYDDLILKENSLTIPHPGIAERDFVLKPLLDLDARLIHPVLHISIEKLYKKILPKDRSIISKV